MVFKSLITSCLPFKSPFTDPLDHSTSKKNATATRVDTKYKPQTTHRVSEASAHLAHFKDKLLHLFAKVFHTKPANEASMTLATVVNLPPLPCDKCDATLINPANAVQSAQTTERYLEKEAMSALVQKGLDNAVQYCKKRDERYGQVESNEIHFHASDIPSMNQLAPVIDYFVAHKREWKSAIHVVQEGWPCSIIADPEKSYLLLPLTIGVGGKKAGIYLAMDLATGKNVVISKIESKTNQDFNTLFLPPYIMNKLNPLFVDDDNGGVLPLKHIFDIMTGTVQQQFVVQKLCEEDNLLTLLSSGIALSPKQIKILADDIFKAVETLHRHGILHKDLKPENFFLHYDKNGFLRAYLGDFDYITSLRSSFQNNPEFKDKVDTVGSFPYLSPEAVLTGEYGPKAESWSVGLVLYSLFSKCQSRFVTELGTKGPEFKYSPSRFNLWSPWAKENPKTKGELLVSNMLRIEPDERIDIKTAYEEFLKIPTDQLSFVPDNKAIAPNP